MHHKGPLSSTFQTWRKGHGLVYVKVMLICRQNYPRKNKIKLTCESFSWIQCLLIEKNSKKLSQYIFHHKLKNDSCLNRFSGANVVEWKMIKTILLHRESFLKIAYTINSCSGSYQVSFYGHLFSEYLPIFDPTFKFLFTMQWNVHYYLYMIFCFYLYTILQTKQNKHNINI